MQGALAKAQQGLEGIFIEKYYISDKADEIGSNEALHAGSVTYRIFVDMLPRYRFQAAYGVTGHPLKLSTSTYFFNNEEFGGFTANDIPNIRLTKSTVMLDSWVSVCAGSEANIAVLKSKDTTSAIVNVDGLLQNSDPLCGISISSKDGLYRASPISVVSVFGLDSTQLAAFGINAPDSKGQTFFTENGSWASFGGSVGLDSTNKVLIAQVTTDGEFSFELNIQLGTPFGGVENYVAKNPIGAEIQFKKLIYNSRELN